MNPIIWTNKTFIEFLINVLAIHGLPWIIGIGLLIFICFIVWNILKKKGIIGKPPIPKLDLSLIINKLIEISESFKASYRIIIELLNNVAEHQESSLNESQARYVLDSLLDSLINKILKKVMEIYQSNNIQEHENIIKNAIKSEMEAMIRTNDYDICKLPNIESLIKPLKEQIKIVDNCCNLIINIMKNENNERDAARKIKSIINTSIKNNWLY